MININIFVVDISLFFMNESKTVNKHWVTVLFYLSPTHPPNDLVELMYLVFTRMPGKTYRRRLRSLLLCLCDVFRAVSCIFNHLYSIGVFLPCIYQPQKY